MRILVVGGYGAFGGRIVTLLADDARLEILVAGRSAAKAKAFCESLAAAATLTPVALDRAGDVEAPLRDLAPAIVIDASGPFQSIGDDPYRFVRAVIDAGAHYIDLADASAFVAGFPALNERALARGVFALTGASTFPTLTAAVCRELTPDLGRVHSIEALLAPSPRADVGLNVLAALASYAGKPVELLRDGEIVTAPGLARIARRAIAPPGLTPLAPRTFGLVDAPDARVLGELFTGLRYVRVGVATAPAITWSVMRALAFLARPRFMPRASPLAPLLHRAGPLARWGEHRGGMRIDIAGADSAGRAVVRAWHMIAEGDDGPFIPAMAAAAIVRMVADGRAPSPGARAAARDVELADYEAFFRTRAIRHGVREETRGEPLFCRVLGSAFDALPPALRDMHAAHEPRVARGMARVERGGGFASRLVAKIFGFPPAGSDVATEVTFASDGARETWTRHFAGRRFRSELSVGEGRNEGLVVERFGPFAFGLALVVDGARLRYVTRSWSFLGMPLPALLAPAGDGIEEEIDGRFWFDVRIAAPIVGLIVRYRGWLAPPTQAPSSRRS